MRFTSSRRAVGAALVVVSLLVASSCKVGVETTIHVTPRGSGTVEVSATFDREAWDALGADAGKRLSLDDMRASGWRIAGPTKVGDGRRVSASRRFANGSELDAVISQLGGEPRVVSDVHLRRHHGLMSSDTALSGRVRLTGSADQFGDAGLAAVLDGLPSGHTAQDLEVSRRGRHGEVTLGLVVNLPGDKGRATGLAFDDTDGGAVASRTWTVGDGEAHDVTWSVSSTTTDRQPLWFGLLAVGLLAASLALFRSGPSRRRPSESTTVDSVTVPEAESSG
ncbi:MAG: hypothetical protein R2698_04025 [Microthrixaceae bacterium]